MILVNSGAFLSISSWFCELIELIFVMIPYISSTGYPPKTQGIMGHVQVANGLLQGVRLRGLWPITTESAGARFSKAPETFRTRKAIFSLSVSKYT